MNMISELRQRVRQNGKAEITAEEFDRLQAEWITRTGADELVEACKRKLLIDLWDSLPGHEATGDTAGSLRATLMLSDVGDEIKTRQRLANRRRRVYRLRPC